VLGEMAVEQVCARVARLAHDTIAGVDEVSVTVLRGSCADTMAATGPLAAGLEEYQYAADAGPCLHAARHRETVLVADMRTEPRWPAYTARAVHAGVFGSLSVPLTLPQGSWGALNLYTRKPSTFAGPATRSPSMSPSTRRSPSPTPRCTPPPPGWLNNANRRGPPRRSWSRPPASSSASADADPTTRSPSWRRPPATPTALSARLLPRWWHKPTRTPPRADSDNPLRCSPPACCSPADPAPTPAPPCPDLGGGVRLGVGWCSPWVDTVSATSLGALGRRMR